MSSISSRLLQNATHSVNIESYQQYNKEDLLSLDKRHKSPTTKFVNRNLVQPSTRSSLGSPARLSEPQQSASQIAARVAAVIQQKQNQQGLELPKSTNRTRTSEIFSEAHPSISASNNNANRSPMARRITSTTPSSAREQRTRSNSMNSNSSGRVSIAGTEKSITPKRNHIIITPAMEAYVTKNFLKGNSAKRSNSNTPLRGSNSATKPLTTNANTKQGTQQQQPRTILDNFGLDSAPQAYSSRGASSRGSITTNRSSNNRNINRAIDEDLGYAPAASNKINMDQPRTIHAANNDEYIFKLMDEMNDLRELVKKYDEEVDYLRNKVHMQQQIIDRDIASRGHPNNANNNESEEVGIRRFVRQAVADFNGERVTNPDEENARLKRELEEALTMILELRDLHQEHEQTKQGFEQEKALMLKTIKMLRSKQEKLQAELEKVTASAGTTSSNAPPPQLSQHDTEADKLLELLNQERMKLKLKEQENNILRRKMKEYLEKQQQNSSNNNNNKHSKTHADNKQSNIISLLHSNYEIKIEKDLDKTVRNSESELQDDNAGDMLSPSSAASENEFLLFRNGSPIPRDLPFSRENWERMEQCLETLQNENELLKAKLRNTIVETKSLKNAKAAAEQRVAVLEEELRKVKKHPESSGASTVLDNIAHQISKLSNELQIAKEEKRRNQLEMLAGVNVGASSGDTTSTIIEEILRPAAGAANSSSILQSLLEDDDPAGGGGGGSANDVMMETHHHQENGSYFNNDNGDYDDVVLAEVAPPIVDVKVSYVEDIGDIVVSFGGGESGVQTSETMAQYIQKFCAS